MPSLDAPLSNEAVETWRRRIREDAFSNYHLEMGVALAANGDSKDAVVQFRQALAVRPDFVLAAINLQETLRKIGAADEAEAVERQMKAVAPDYPTSGFLALATFLDERGLFDAARDAAAAAPASSPAALHWRAYLAFKGGERGGDLGTLPALDDADARATLAERYRLYAAHVLSETRFSLGARAFDRASYYQPEDLEWGCRQAVALLSIGRFAESADLLERVIARPNVTPPSISLIGQANIAARRLDRATELAEAELARRPGGPEALIVLGLCAANRGDWKACETHQRAALASNAKNAFALSNLGLALQGQGRLDEAIKAHQNSLAAQEVNFWAYTNLGLAFTAAGDAAAAERAHRRAMEQGRAFLLYQAALRHWAFDGLVGLYRSLGAFADLD